MPTRYLQQEIVDTLFALAEAAQGQGATELLIGYPTPSQYGFSAHGTPYQGAVDQKVIGQLCRALARQKRATLRESSRPVLTLGVMDLFSPVIYLSWPSAAKPRRTAPECPKPRTARILLLEDDHQIAALICAGLVRAGFEVLHCATTSEARRALSEPGAAFDLLLSDLHLPEGDGRRFLRDMRTEHSRLPILVLTAECDSIEMRSTIDAGIDAYLWKGSEPEVLLAWIRNLTNPERHRRFNI